MSARTHRWLVPLTTYILPIVALLIGAAVAGKPVSVLFSLAEPLLLALLITALVSALLAHQHGLSVSILISGVIATVAMNHPTEETSTRSDGPEWLRTLKGCAILSQPVKAPVRLIMWSVDNDLNIQDEMPNILELNPDVIVFNGSARIDIGGHLSDALDGEVKFFANEHSSTGLTAVVRGSFQYCGEEKDVWMIPLSNDSGSDGQAIVTFPLIEEVGVFPFVITRLATRTSSGGWMPWAHAVHASAGEIANGVSTIGTRKMVLMGDLQVPHHASPLAEPLSHAGLRPAISGPNWPANVMGVPFLTQHALDQAWVGHGWTIQATRTLPIGNQSRLPILFDLVPTTQL